MVKNFTIKFFNMSNIEDLSKNLNKFTSECLDSLNLILKKQKKKNKEKIIIEKTKLLKELCNDHNLDFDSSFDKYIKPYHDTETKSKKNKMQSNGDTMQSVGDTNKSIDTEDSDGQKEVDEDVADEKILSNIEIGKNKYWIDELNNLYSSTNFELIGVFDNGKIVKIGKSKKTSKKQAKLI